MSRRSPYALVKEAREKLSMSNVKFSQIGPDEPIVLREDQVDAFIRERTQLWMQSWVVPLLDEALVKLEKRDGPGRTRKAKAPADGCSN